MEYDDFRIEVIPRSDSGVQGLWDVKLVDCPVPKMVGSEDLGRTVALSAQQLQQLRSPIGHPDPTLVRAAGEAVWQTLMGAKVGMAFVAVCDTQKKSGRGLRLVTVLRGSDGGGAQIKPVDLPLEAMHNEGFLVNDLSTPFARSFNSKSDYVPGVITAPLRVLLVTACPTDLPPANITQEVDAIQRVLQPYAKQGQVHIELCANATVPALQNAVAGNKFDIVHFVCHGSRGMGADSCLCLCDDNQLAISVDAGSLNELLRNTAMRLVIFSACSSAASPGPALPGMPLPAYPVSAFAGIAQSLIRTHDQLGAIVAMQFDFEATAAVLFSGKFYMQLLAGKGLEHAVAAGRAAVFGKMTGLLLHRAWVTPVIYTRCRAGELFDLSALQSTPLSTANEETLSKLNQIAKIFLETLETMCRSVGASLLEIYRQSLDKLNSNRREAIDLLMPAARVEHVSSAAGKTTQLKMLLSLPMGRCAELAKVKVQLPAGAKLVAATREYPLSNGAAPGPGAPQVVRRPCPLAIEGNLAELFISSGEAAFDADGVEHPLVDLDVAIDGNLPAGRLAVELVSIELLEAGSWRTLAALGGSIFIES